MNSSQNVQPALTSRNSVPREINWVMLCFIVIGVIHYVAIFLIATHRQDADLSPLTQNIFESSMIIHVIMGTIFILMRIVIRTGRNWLRILATVLLVIQLLAHLSIVTLIRLLPDQAVPTIAVQAISLVFELAALFLLWRSQQAGVYFKARKGRLDMQAGG